MGAPCVLDESSLLFQYNVSCTFVSRSLCECMWICTPWRDRLSYAGLHFPLYFLFQEQRYVGELRLHQAVGFHGERLLSQHEEVFERLATRQRICKPRRFHGSFENTSLKVNNGLRNYACTYSRKPFPPIPVRVGLDWRIGDKVTTGNTLTKQPCLRFGACCARCHSMAQVEVVNDLRKIHIDQRARHQ